jgi:hypothetical protein
MELVSHVVPFQEFSNYNFICFSRLLCPAWESQPLDITVTAMVGYMQNHTRFLPIPLAARSEAWVSSRSLDGIADSNPAAGMNVCVVSCEVEVSASG